MRFCIGILLLSLFLFSCASKQDIPRAKKASIEEVLDGLESNQRDYKYFSSKGKIKFNGDEFRIGGRCNIRMIKDSLIWMNFKKLSIEGARMLITQDSFWIMYRLENYYESGTLDEFLTEYNVHFNFEQLQDFIVGNVPVPAADEVNRYDTDRFHRIDFDRSIYNYKYQLDGSYRIHRIMVNDPQDRILIGTFSDYDEVNFASNKELQLYTPEEGNATISITLSSVEFDVPKQIKFEIPSHYTTF